MAKINPFVPNSPVNPGMFVGRLEEVSRLERYLLQTRAGEAAHFMVTGERGIGKSSLLMYLRFQAEGRIPVDGQTLKFLVVDTSVDRNTTQFGLVKKIEFAIRKGLEKSEPGRVFLTKAWEFVKRVEAGGVKLREGARDAADQVLLDEFAYSLAETAARLAGPDGEADLFEARCDGILILIDEADNGSKSLELGSFLKLLTEALRRRGCGNVMIGLAGLPELRAGLAESHPSAPRALQEVSLGRLSQAEVGQVIDLCLRRAREKHGADVTIEDDAKEWLISLSEGYPHFIQQFGFSAYERDTDNRIDAEDVKHSAFGETGALSVIGDNYYRDDFYKKIQVESYRHVLRIMADNLDGWVKKKDIATRFGGKASSLTNAIHALRGRRIIRSKEGAPGVYRLQHKGFALWIKLYATPPDELDLIAKSRTASSAGAVG